MQDRPLKNVPDRILALALGDVDHLYENGQWPDYHANTTPSWVSAWSQDVPRQYRMDVSIRRVLSECAERWAERVLKDQ